MSEAIEETVGLALLDGYKVRWSRATVARDIVQNFYDEVDDFDDVEVEVDDERASVEVRGPSRFDLEYLKYIGATTKATRARSAGGFGEGFKVCALVLIRDFACAVTAGSGRWEIRPFLRPMKLGRELCYEVRTLPEAEAYPGSFVRIEGADARLRETFDHVKDLFRHPDNPRLGRPIHVDDAAGAGVFASVDPRMGDVYYRGQHRGRIRYPEGAGLTFTFDERIDALEGDRDRRDLAVTGPLVAAVAARLPDDVLERLIRHLRAYWQRGGRVLGELCAEAARRGMRLAFPRRWLSRVARGYWIERRAERLGFHLGVAKLAAIGMPSVAERLGSSDAPRAPTAVEAARIVVARDLYTHLSGRPAEGVHVRVVDLERAGSDFRTRSCVVPAPVLAAPFTASIALVLERLACTAGIASRRDADRLTALLEGAVRRAGALEGFAERWEAAARDPSREAIDTLPRGDGDDDDTPFPVRRGLLVAVLAPAGFPPADELFTRIEAMCKEQGFSATRMNERVHGPREALAAYCRGVPSVWIGSTEVEARRGARVAYEVRTFAAKEGARSLVPGDEALREVIAKEVALARKGGRTGGVRIGARREKGKHALLRWLFANAPDEYLAKVVDDVLGSGFGAHEAPMMGVYGMSKLMTLVARPALLAGAIDEGFPAAAVLAVEQTIARMDALLAAAAERAPGILDQAPAAELALRTLVQRAIEVIGRGAPADAALDELLASAAVVRSLAALFDDVPLDTPCAYRCTERALARYWELADAGAKAAEEGARERFDAAVERAMARHEERDAEGQPRPCHELSAALDVLFGVTRVPPVPASAVAVRAAWEDARAAGLSEVEAAARCLAVAAPFEGTGPA